MGGSQQRGRRLPACADLAPSATGPAGSARAHVRATGALLRGRCGRTARFSILLEALAFH
jgi:hypothetical protein